MIMINIFSFYFSLQTTWHLLQNCLEASPVAFFWHYDNSEIIKCQSFVFHDSLPRLKTIQISLFLLVPLTNFPSIRFLFCLLLLKHLSLLHLHLVLAQFSLVILFFVSLQMWFSSSLRVISEVSTCGIEFTHCRWWLRFLFSVPSFKWIRVSPTLMDAFLM